MIISYDSKEIKAMMDRAVHHAKANMYFLCPYDNADEVNAYMAGATAVYNIVKDFFEKNGTVDGKEQKNDSA